jgi:hypothetical protein
VANVLKIKNSGTANSSPTANILQHGELAINYNDGRLFYKNASNSIVAFNLSSASGGVTVSDTPPSGSEGDLWFESDTGKLFIYYDDVWSEIVSSEGPAGPEGPPGPAGADPEPPVVVSTFSEDTQTNDQAENEIAWSNTIVDQGWDWGDNGFTVPEDGIYEIHLTLLANNSDDTAPHQVIGYGKVDGIEDYRLSGVVESIPADLYDILDWHWTADFTAGEELSFWWIGTSPDISIAAGTIGDLSIFSARLSICLVSGGSEGPQGEPGAWDSAQVINDQSTNYTLLSSDAGKLVSMDSTSNRTITVNTSLDLQPGQRIDLLRLNTGLVEVVASGTTVNATPGLKLRARYSAATLLCIASNTYILSGDLSA